MRTRKGDGTEKVFHPTSTNEGVSFFKQLCAGRAGNELMLQNTGRVQRGIETKARLKTKAIGVNQNSCA